jgi:hypothetical protein
MNSVRTLWLNTLVLALLLAARLPVSANEAAEEAAITIRWEEVVQVSKTVPTFQVVINPLLRRGSKIHGRAFQAVKDSECEYIRYAGWFPYPRLAVAELEPPRDGKTSWDFSLIDPMTEDFMSATRGRSAIINFGTIPQWMFKTPQPVTYPADPDEPFWKYSQGTEFNDPTLKEVADYHARLVGWYTQGGFNDEYGKRHESGHHYKMDHWEILNEVDYEHSMTPQTYTRVYDAIVEAVRKVNPQMKFVGLAIAGTSPNVAMELDAPPYFQYFLDPKNHKPGIPLDMISYHAYVTPTPDQTMETAPFSVFEQADHFVDVVRYIESIRRRLSPETRTVIDEIGTMGADDVFRKRSDPFRPIPNAYWNLGGAIYAYCYAQLARVGIDVVGESQLVGYPSQYPSVSMVDWDTGQPNARYWALKLVKDNFGPGDKLVQTSTPSPYVFPQAFVTKQGKRKVLLVNKRNRPFEVALRGAAGGEETYVDQTTGFQPPASRKLTEDRVMLPGLAVSVVTLPTGGAP